MLLKTKPNNISNGQNQSKCLFRCVMCGQHALMTDKDTQCVHRHGCKCEQCICVHALAIACVTVCEKVCGLVCV